MGEDERPLEDVVRGVISKFDNPTGLTQEKISEIWEDVAGKKASMHSRPTSFKRSRLVVNVDGSSWLYELTLRKQKLLKKLEKAFVKQGRGEKRPKDIQFRIGEV